MSSEQLTIPGLELPPVPAKPKPQHIQERIASLESQVFQLEMEITLLRIQLDREGKDHA
ncbi:hypothetical protein ES703_110125 [subsurface metagenome]